MFKQFTIQGENRLSFVMHGYSYKHRQLYNQRITAWSVFLVNIHVTFEWLMSLVSSTTPSQVIPYSQATTKWYN